MSNLINISGGQQNCSGSCSNGCSNCNCINVKGKLNGANDSFPSPLEVGDAFCITADGNNLGLDVKEGDLVIFTNELGNLDTSNPANWKRLGAPLINPTLGLSANILTFTDGLGNSFNFDLTPYLDDTNLARLVSGTLAPSGIATFTRDDSTTFDVDFSPLFDDTNLARIISGSIVSDDIVLTRDDSSTILIDISSLATDADITNLQTQITSNDADIVNLQTQITDNDNDIVNLQTQITDNDNDITGLQTQITNNDTDITNLQTQITDNDNDISNLQAQITSNDTDITNLQNSKLDSVVAGTNVSIDNTDPLNPIINVTDDNDTSVVTNTVTGNRIATHDDGTGNTVDINETITGLGFAGNILTYTKEDGTTDTIDLSIYIDDTNLARLVSGSVDPLGIATFTRDDLTTFTVDFSGLFDDTNLARITSGAISGTDIILTRDDSSTVTIDISTLATDAEVAVLIAGLQAQITANDGDITNLQNTKLDGIVAGTNVTVDNTDPLNPIVNATDTNDTSVITDNLDGTYTHDDGTGNTVTIDTNKSLTLTTENIIVGFASGYQSTGTTLQSRNATITNTAVGQYTVTFGSTHPDGANYEVLFGVHESGVTRDVPKISVVEGSQTANGFDIQVTTDDNGGTADVYDNEPFAFEVLREITVLTNVTIS